MKPGSCKASRTQALAEWDQALAAYEQAALLEPGEAAPRLAAAEVCKAAGRRDAAVAGYQQALAIVNALKPPPEGVRQAIYEALIALLEDQKRVAEAERYRTLQREQMAESIRLTLQDVGRAIRDGKADEAVGDAERIVKGRPEDPLAYVALGLAERAKKDDAKALEAYRRAFELTKDVPAQQMVLIEYLLQTRDPSDAAEAEKALRGLLPRYAPAYLRLVGLLELRGKNDEALAVAQGGVEGHPKDPLALVALGTAWWGKNDLSKAESTFQAAAALAPDAAGPATALLVFYAATGRQELARNVLEQMLGKVKLPEIDGDLLRADCLVRIGDRKNAKDAYRKAVEASKEDPAVQMRLAEFLLGSSDPDDEVEGEQLLRRHHATARPGTPPPCRSPGRSRRRTGMGGSPEVTGTVGRRSHLGRGPLRPGPIARDPQGRGKSPQGRGHLPGTARRGQTADAWRVPLAGPDPGVAGQRGRGPKTIPRAG